MPARGSRAAPTTGPQQSYLRTLAQQAGERGRPPTQLSPRCLCSGR
ncbi:MAG TPA: DUF3072 domain-containing protein [Pseudonocardia sp.]